MSAQPVKLNGSQLKLEITIDLSCSMLETETAIQSSLNEASCLATQAALQFLDTGGSAIKVSGELMRTKGKQPKAYQTPYGEVVVERHVYREHLTFSRDNSIEISGPMS